MVIYNIKVNMKKVIFNTDHNIVWVDMYISKLEDKEMNRQTRKTNVNAKRKGNCVARVLEGEIGEKKCSSM